MYISIDTPTRSIRPHTDSDGSVLIVGGGGHPTGRDDDSEAQHADLQHFAKERFGMSGADWRWSAQDFVPADGLAFIGPITTESPRTFVATGYAKWGMTNGTVAAMVISDAILGRENPWAETFDSTRVDAPRSIGTVLSQGAHTVKSIIGDRIASFTAMDAEELAVNHGAVIRVDGKPVAAFSPRRWECERGHRNLHSSRLHRSLQHCGAVLGLPVSWIEVRPRGPRHRRPGDHEPHPGPDRRRVGNGHRTLAGVSRGVSETTSDRVPPIWATHDRVAHES